MATIVLTHWSGTVIIIVCSVVFCSTILSAVSTPWSGTVAALVFWVDCLIHSSSGCCLIVGSLWNVSVCFYGCVSIAWSSVSGAYYWPDHRPPICQEEPLARCDSPTSRMNFRAFKDSELLPPQSASYRLNLRAFKDSEPISQCLSADDVSDMSLYSYG